MKRFIRVYGSGSGSVRHPGVDDQLLRAIKSFYCRPEVCVRVNVRQSKPFHVGVGLPQGCVMSPFFFFLFT